MIRRSFLAVALLVGACGPDPEPEPAPAAPPTVDANARALSSVLDDKLNQYGVERRTDETLARELRTNEGLLPEGAEDPDATTEGTSTDAPPPTAPELDPELVEMRDGLLDLVVSDPNQLATAQGDFRHLGAEVTDVLVDGLRDAGRSDTELRFLGDFASVVPDARLAEEAMRIAATHETDWVRRYFAWLVAGWSEADGADVVVPALLRRLKYEKDVETFVWVGRSLAAFDNYAGLDAMFDIANRTTGEAFVESARVELARIAGARAAEGEEAPPIGTIAVGWYEGTEGRTDASTPPPGDALRGELWRLVADLSGEHFQLRGVDDARYVLSRLGPWAGAELGLALGDDDEYVRLHVAQVLERMGKRGRLSFESLVESLRDPHAAVAGAGAEALAAIAPDDRAAEARDALLARLDETPPYEVRVAITRALGRLGDAAPIDRLQALFADAPASDQKLAAAEGLLRLAPTKELIDWLADEMTARVGDPAGAESLLERWLGEGDDRGRAELRPIWESHAPDAAIVHTGEQAKARRAARAEAVRGLDPTPAD